MNDGAQPRERGGALPHVQRAKRLVWALTLAWICSGCLACAGTGPANRAEEFQDLARQLDSEPEDVKFAGKVQWHVGADGNLWEFAKTLVDENRARVRERCEAQKARTGGWCLLVAQGHPDKGVFLMTDRELAFFRWDYDSYVLTTQVPYEQIEKVRLGRWGVNKFVVIHKDGEPLLLFVLINRAAISNSGTEALHEALSERVQWHQPKPAPL